MAKPPKEMLDDLVGYKDFTRWIVVSDGETGQLFPSYDEAVDAAKEQAENTPNLVLAVYELKHFVSARVQEPTVFDVPAGHK